jgi:hypothetical protein
VKVPEKILVGFPGIIATSDTVIIDQSKMALDLAGYILKKNNKLKSLIQLRRRGGLFGKR